MEVEVEVPDKILEGTTPTDLIFLILMQRYITLICHFVPYILLLVLVLSHCIGPVLAKFKVIVSALEQVKLV